MRSWLAVLIVVASPALAQQLDGFERVFIPFMGANISGVGDSRFQVRGTSITRAAYSYWPHCGFNSTTPEFGRVEKSSGVPIPLICAGGTRGRIVFVERGAAEQISFGYELNSSAAGATAQTHHVSVPIARERDFRRERFHIVVPYGLGRTVLRVYELSGRPDAAVKVTALASIFSWASGTGTETVALTNREGDDPSYPLFAETTLRLGCFVVSPRVCTTWDAAIEIEPLTPGDYWAVVSRTDDVTQQVTLYWPQ